MTLKSAWPRRIARWGGELLILVVLLISVEAWMTRDVPRDVPALLAGETTGGRVFDVTQWKGRSGVIYFWAEWCPVCKANRHVIESLARDHPVMTVAMQSGNSREVAVYMEKESIAFPVIADEEGSIARSFHVTGVPVALIIDRQGRISHVARGYTTELGLRIRLWLASRA